MNEVIDSELGQRLDRVLRIARQHLFVAGDQRCSRHACAVSSVPEGSSPLAKWLLLGVILPKNTEQNQPMLVERGAR
jgi:hypothetical protein